MTLPTDNRGARGRAVARLGFLTVVAAWFGAMAFFGAVVAPSAFAALPSRQLAGLLVNESLGRLNALGYVLGPLSAFLLLACEPPARWRRAGFLVSLGLVVLMGVASFASHAFVTSRLEELRAAMGLIDEVPVGDPRRQEFAWLHGVSVALMGFQAVASIVVLAAVGLSWVRDADRSR
jgi:hypothetical protein